MLTINETCTTFSDGSTVWFDIWKSKAVVVKESSSNDKPPRGLDAEHAKVVFSDTAIIIYMPAGPLPPKGVRLSAPVSVGKIYKTIFDFYGTKLSAAEHAALKDWCPGLPGDSLKELCRTYSDIQLGYWFEGLKPRRFIEKYHLLPPHFSRPHYPPFDGCRHTCKVYKTYDVCWAT